MKIEDPAATGYTTIMTRYGLAWDLLTCAKFRFCEQRIETWLEVKAGTTRVGDLNSKYPSILHYLCLHVY